MKTIKVDRWESQVEIQVPSSAVVVESEVRVQPTSDPADMIRKALRNPMGMEGIRGLVGKGSRVAIAFDDPTKLCPSYQGIPLVLEELYQSGVKKENMALVCASGSHKRYLPNDFLDYRNVGYGLPPGKGIPKMSREIFDSFWPHQFIRHNASDSSGLVDMGYSHLNDFVEYNRILTDYDLVIYIGSVQSMKWGGYSGTGVVIGLASAKSLVSHHTFDVIGHKDSCHANAGSHLYRSHKDAVMERIEEFTGKKVFYLEGVANGARQWINISAGHFKEIQEPTWRAADQERLYTVEQADVIVAGLPRWCVYDTTRNPLMCGTCASSIVRSWVGKPVLREGGVIILVAVCDGYIDPEALPSYSEVLDLYNKMGNSRRLEERYLEQYLKNEEYLKKYEYGYAVHPVHPFWLIAEQEYIHDHASKLIIATAENPEAVRKIGASWAESFDQAWRMAEKVVGKNPRTLVLPSFFSRYPFKFAVK